MSINKIQEAQRKKLKRQAEGMKLLQKAAQLLGYAVKTNPKASPSEPTVGYVIGRPDWVVYVDELQKEDLLEEIKETV